MNQGFLTVSRIFLRRVAKSQHCTCTLSLYDYDVKLSNFTFYHERKQTTPNFSFAFRTRWWRSYKVSFGHLEKEKKTKKVESPLKFWDGLIFLFFFSHCCCWKGTLCLLNQSLPTATITFSKYRKKKSSKIKCGMCFFFNVETISNSLPEMCLFPCLLNCQAVVNFFF